MKNHFLCSLLAVTTLGLSSCCCLFSGSNNKYTTTETRICGYKTVTKEVPVSGNGSKGGMLTETVTVKEPIYKEVNKKQTIKCVRSYCPKSGPCGSTSDELIRMSSDQGSTGSPHIGLIPSMKVLAP